MGWLESPRPKHVCVKELYMGWVVCVGKLCYSINTIQYDIWYIRRTEEHNYLIFSKQLDGALWSETAYLPCFKHPQWLLYCFYPVGKAPQFGEPCGWATGQEGASNWSKRIRKWRPGSQKSYTDTMQLWNSATQRSTTKCIKFMISNFLSFKLW